MRSGYWITVLLLSVLLLPGFQGSPGYDIENFNHSISIQDASNVLHVHDDRYIFSMGSQRIMGPNDLILGPLVFDPADEDFVSILSENGYRKGHFIVQTSGPVDPLLRQYLAGLDNVHLIETISWNSILLRSDSNDHVAEMDRISPDIRAILPYHSVMAIDTTLYHDIMDRNPNDDGSFEVAVGSYVPINREILDRFQLIIDGEVRIHDENTIFATVDKRDIASLSMLSHVSHISPVLRGEIDNDVAADIIDVKETWSTLGLNGSGQMIAVADTGLDTGKNSTIHSDVEGRVKHAYAYGRSGKWSDPDIHVWDSTTGSWKYKGGHGTHVVGSALGDGNASSGKYSGMAPEADLVMQSTMTSTGSLSIPAYSRLFGDAYKSGARIHTNSWSSRSSYGNYSWRSWKIDNYLWSNRDMVVHFSAGNKGTSGQNMVSTQACSKNVIAVGASENYRPSLSTGADNASEIAYFSSRGYTWGDGRIKPDVVAPGSWILSMRASTITDHWNHYWGNNATYNGINSKYAYMGGTSMSTPMVAGMSALVRQYFQENESVDSPSSALVKAAVINGARPLDGEWSSVPNRYEGWGLVNLSNSLSTPESDVGDLYFIDNRTGLSTSSSHTRNMSLSGDGTDLVMTLVWTDPPGSNTSSTKLINDLDLRIETPKGEIYNGNDLSAPYNSTRDSKNNVERIRIPSPSAGIYRLTVDGYSVSNGPQPYAVVASFSKPDHRADLAFRDQSVPANGSQAVILLSDTNLTGQGTCTVKVNSTTDGTGEDITLYELNDGNVSTGIFRGSINVTRSIPGNGEVRVAGDETIFARFNESHPPRRLSASTRALMVPEITDIDFRPRDRTYTLDDKITVLINGTVDCSVAFTIPGLDGVENVDVRDDGQKPDEKAGDGTYTGETLISGSVDDDLDIVAYITRAQLDAQVKRSSVTVSVNTEVPRSPKNLSAEPLQRGNAVRLKWNETLDTDIVHYTLLVSNSTVQDLSLVKNTTGVTTHAVIDGLEDEKRYLFAVVANDAQGYGSFRSEPVMCIPQDIKGPWIEWNSPRSGSVISGRVKPDLSLENDTEALVVQGAADNNGDGDPDGIWLDLLEVNDPVDGFVWDTTELPSRIWEGKDVLLRIRATDERMNVNVTDVLAIVRFDNTPPSDLVIDVPHMAILGESSYRIKGTTEPFAMVRLEMGNEQNITSEADGSGNFMIEPELEPGVNEPTISVYDRYGNGPLFYHDDLMLVYDNVMPVADMIWGENMTSGMTWISAGNSLDPGPDSPLTGISEYEWTVVTGDDTILFEGRNISFEPSSPGVVEVTLEIVDNAGNSVSKTEDITIKDGIPPELEPLEDMEVEEGSPIVKVPIIEDDDPDLNMNGRFLWQIDGPEYFEITGHVLDTVIDLPGEYEIHFRVTDTGGNSASEAFHLTVVDITPPIADAGQDLTVIRGRKAHLKAYNSTDEQPDFPEGAVFRWKIPDLDMELTGINTSFEAYLLGTFSVLLEVKDASGNRGTDEVKINVVTDGEAPTLNFSSPLDGSDGFDPQSDIHLVFSEPLDLDRPGEMIDLMEANGKDVGKTASLSDDGMMVLIDPANPLVNGREYIVSVSGELTDMSGEVISPFKIRFVVRNSLVLLGVDWDGSKLGPDERVFRGAPGPITLSLSDELENGSNIRVVSSTGESVDPSIVHIVEGRYRIEFPDGLEPGDYEINLSSAVSADGEPFNGSDSITFAVEARRKSDGPSMPLMISISLLFLLVAAGTALFIRRYRLSGRHEEREMDTDNVAPSKYGNDFYDGTGNDK